MTYYYTESAVAGANEEKLVIEVWTSPDVDDIDWDTDSVSIHAYVRAYQAKYSGDNQTFNRTGSWGGSTNFYMPATANTWVTIADQWWDVNTQEGSDVHLNIDGNISGHYGGASFSAGIDVDIDARPYPASSFTLSTNNFDMGTATTVNISELNSVFTHTVRYSFGALSGTIANKTTSLSVAWTPDIATFAAAIPNAASSVGTIWVDTYNGSTKVGTTSKNFTLKVPTSVVPSLTTVNHSETISTVSTIVGKYAKNLSKIAVSLTGYAGIYGSTITKQEVIFQGITYNVTQAGATSLTWTMPDPLNASGSIDIVGRVTDSRGYTKSTTVTIDALDYVAPAISTFNVQRALSNGTLDAVGTYAKVTSIGSVSSLLNTTQRNTLTYTILYRARGTAPWTTLKADTVLAVGTLALDVVETLGTGQFAATNAYEFRLDVKDKFNTTLTILVVGTGQVTLSLNKAGIGVGKVWQQGTIDAEGDIYASGDVYSRGVKLGVGFIMPVGSIHAYAAAAAPTGYSLCDGGTLSRTTEAALFAVIGTTYGAGDGSTTFNKPNLKGRIPVGLDSAQTEFNTLNKSGGAKTHTLSVTEMPSHNHAPTSGNANFWGYNDADTEATIASGSAFDIRGATTTGSTGGDGAHNNLQPYLVVNYIIKL